MEVSFITGHSMSWYGRPYLIIFLYISPTIFSVAAVFHFASFRQKKVLTKFNETSI